MIYKYLSVGPQGSATQFGGVLDSLSLKFSRLSSFNDVFEGTPEASGTLDPIVADLKNQALATFPEGIESASQKLRITPKEAVDKLFDLPNQKFAFSRIVMSQADRMGADIGVLSASLIPDSLLLWSHYARSEHSALAGICLGIDEVEARLDEVGIDFLGIKGGRNVEYANLRPQVNTLPLPENLNRILITKSLDWSYEQERRYFVELDTGKPSYYFPIMSSAIRQIIAGPRADLTFLKSLHLFASEHFPHAKKLIALPSLSEYKVNLEKMPSLKYLDGYSEPSRSNEVAFIQKVKDKLGRC
jgi:hypothetical protein